MFPKMFPGFLAFWCLLRILLHTYGLYLNSFDEAAQLMIIKAGKARSSFSSSGPSYSPKVGIGLGGGGGWGVGKEEVAKPQIKNWKIFLQLQNLLFLI